MSEPGDLPDLVCSRCGTRYPVASLAWRCSCGGLLDVADPAPVLDLGDLGGPAADGGPAGQSLWRYRSVLPVPFDPAVSLGEGLTPLVPARGLANVRYKLDLAMPTLSFKDRGAVVLATLAARLRPERAVVDSSGNAGTSAAAYLARAGVPCEVLVPAATSPGKLAQARAHGATVTLVPGDRAATSAAALALADVPGTLYASHVFHPYFLHGVKTYAYELWERSGRRLPDTVVLPVGNGTLVLGCSLAFAELLAAGLADRVPAIVAVQAASCAPLAAAFAAGRDDAAPVVPAPTAAEGIAIAAPPRAGQILAAVRSGGGVVVTVTDEQVLRARAGLAAEGLYVEPTAAACRAALDAAATGTGPVWGAARELLSRPDVVLPLCGAGLKSP